MKKILLACDLDNTLIHSYRHKKENDICIEMINDKQQGFISSHTYELIKNLPENITLLPVTTRSIEQYMRIKWEKAPEYALVTNGTILLKNNIPLEYEDINKYYNEIQNLERKINPDDFTKIKLVDNMYLFAYRDKSDGIEKFAEKYSKMTTLETQFSGRKIYFFPPPANKGRAVKKFSEKFNYDFIISSGDSSIDFSMFEISDIAIVPNKETAQKINHKNIKICPENKVFSEFILETAFSL